MCFSSGINSVAQSDKLILVLNQGEVSAQFSEMLPDDCNINGLAIIYKKDESVLVSPCYIGNRVVYVYTNCQQLIASENLMVYTGTYDEIIPVTVELIISDDAQNETTEEK